MESAFAFSKKSISSSSKAKLEETDEARKKFSNAKSIPPAQFFGSEIRTEMPIWIQKLPSRAHQVSSLLNLSEIVHVHSMDGFTVVVFKKNMMENDSVFYFGKCI